MNRKPMCLAPFLSIYSNPVGYSPCCYIAPVKHESLDEYLTSGWLNELREAHLNHDRKKVNTRCSTCMSKSKTTFFFELGYQHNQDLSKYWDNGGRDLVYYYLAPDITCGMSCGMCLVSNKRLDELTDWGIRDLIDLDKDTVYQHKMRTQEFMHIYHHLPNARSVSIYGGDPTMSMSTIDIIENTPDSAAVRYSSNGQFTKLRNGQGLIDALSKFKKVSFTISLDGLGEIGQRIRKGINFKTLNKLIISASEQPNFRVEICMTVSLYNVVEVTKLFDEIYDKYVETGLADTLFFNPVYEPSFMAVSALPFELKKKVIGELAKLMINATGKKKEVLSLSYVSLISALREKSIDTEWQKFIKVCRREEDITTLTPISELIPQYRPFFEAMII